MPCCCRANTSFKSLPEEEQARLRQEALKNVAAIERIANDLKATIIVVENPATGTLKTFTEVRE